MKKTDKQMSESYIERDISWMYFNQRILLEAQKESVPLLERLTFLGIYSNNLDEFFARFKGEFNVRGGGRNGMVQGTVFASEDEIKVFFEG